MQSIELRIGSQIDTDYRITALLDTAKLQEHFEMSGRNICARLKTKYLMSVNWQDAKGKVSL
jgi:hypothetical protein